MLTGKESSSLGGAGLREAGVSNCSSPDLKAQNQPAGVCALQARFRAPICPETRPASRCQGNCGHSVLSTLRVSSVPCVGGVEGVPGQHPCWEGTATIGKPALGLSSDSSLVAPGNMWPPLTLPCAHVP